MVGVTHIGRSGGNRKGWRGQGGRRDFVKTRTGDRREGEQRSQLLSTRERGKPRGLPSDGVYLPRSAKAQRRPSGSMLWVPSQGGRGGGQSDSRRTKSPDPSKEGASTGRLFCSPRAWVTANPVECELKLPSNLSNF